MYLLLLIQQYHALRFNDLPFTVQQAIAKFGEIDPPIPE